mmetsp:Transcript_11342/g.23180  ORF Transcript_11342/g.23180 Transcript_11342/m.23180 type:complete len:225 (-) Transcript_11342:36-710(-)
MLVRRNLKVTIPTTYEEWKPLVASPNRPNKKRATSKAFSTPPRPTVVKPLWANGKEVSIFGVVVDVKDPGDIPNNAVLSSRNDGQGWYDEISTLMGCRKKIPMGIFGIDVPLDNDDVDMGDGDDREEEKEKEEEGPSITSQSSKVSLPTLVRSPNLPKPNEKWARYATPSVFGFIIEDGWEEKERAAAAATTIQLWFKRCYINWALTQRRKRNLQLKKSGQADA